VKNIVFWDVTPCSSSKNRYFGGTYRHEGEINQRARNNVRSKQWVYVRNVLQPIDTANVVPSSLILLKQMKEAIRSSETSVLTRDTQRDVPEDDILHSHRRENLKSYFWGYCSLGSFCDAAMNFTPSKDNDFSRPLQKTPFYSVVQLVSASREIRCTAKTEKTSPFHSC
jgi:hypothetical protein